MSIKMIISVPVMYCDHMAMIPRMQKKANMIATRMMDLPTVEKMKE